MHQECYIAEYKNILLKLIHVLANGMFYSKSDLENMLCKQYSTIIKYIMLIQTWGINVLIIPDKGCKLYKPLCLINTSFIKKRLLNNNRIIYLPIIQSTNQYLIKHINKLIPGDTCITEYQLQGRGKYGKQWIALFGRSICLSIYWYLNFNYMQSNNLSLMVAIVIAEVLNKIKGVIKIKIKWPNDLYLNNRKLAGILIEKKWNILTHVIIGIGINILKFESRLKSMDQFWISLEELNVNIDRNLLIAYVINALYQALKEFTYKGFTPFFSRWDTLDYLYNRTIKLIINKTTFIIGVVKGINIEGELLLEVQKKIYSYTTGTVLLFNNQ